MNERDLDRAIDAAAGAMMTREPSRSLGYSVMARVREDHAPAPRRFAWVTAAASLVVCGAIAMTLISQTPAPVAPLPRAVQLTVGQPPVMSSAPVLIVTDAPPARRVSRAAHGAMRELPPSDASPIEPIQTEPIVLSAIDVPQLERETTAIDALNVEPLTIEPLAASND